MVQHVVQQWRLGAGSIQSSHSYLSLSQTGASAALPFSVNSINPADPCPSVPVFLVRLQTECVQINTLLPTPSACVQINTLLPTQSNTRVCSDQHTTSHSNTRVCSDQHTTSHSDSVCSNQHTTFHSNRVCSDQHTTPATETECAQVNTPLPLKQSVFRPTHHSH